ncbi:FAD-containing oxidoreductase [Deinococcus irradiatisoli]|uniref:FAD-containing oxidoreductase n=1 Tax=Deinococcus irradiatisoli TaxID=2202254 RepID=A0A2Z3JRI7_9DEIO|nr:mercuric reductase [Deinococcus irradiatisoli]AWN23414.1 FAD-containing oxidoreductase [Deinococcus irradiatisoli]
MTSATPDNARPQPSPSALVIGAGQAGGPLAGALAQAGWSVTLIEREHVGGTCVNEGCTPTKAMIASAQAAHTARHSGALGVHAAEVGIDLGQIVDRVQGIVRDFREGSEAGLLNSGVTLLAGEARFTGLRQVEVTLTGGKQQTFSADYVFINAGARPRWPEVPGLSDVGALTSREMLHLRELPTHLLILGGGYISLEFAQLFARLGSRVTVIESGPRLLPREDEDVAAALQAVLESEGVAFVLGASAQEARREEHQTTLKVQVGGDTVTLSGSHLLVAVGRRPNTDGLNVEATGAQLDRHGNIQVDDQLLAAERVYALGDIKGGPAFTHISYDDYRIVRGALLEGQQRRTSQRWVPYTLFTDPQLGQVGLNRQQALTLGRPTRVYTLPMSSVARAIEMGATAGMMRAVVDDHTDQLLGVTVLGPEGGEVMGALQLAMMGRLSAAELRNATLAHPTLCESVNNLFMSEPERLAGQG